MCIDWHTDIRIYIQLKIKIKQFKKGKFILAYSLKAVHRDKESVVGGVYIVSHIALAVMKQTADSKWGQSSKLQGLPPVSQFLHQGTTNFQNNAAAKDQVFKHVILWET